MLLATIKMIDFTSPGTWISLVTLCFLEVVLGIDNIIFISIITGKLPAKDQAKIRNIGMMMAMVFRIGLLLGINWLIGLTQPIVTVPAIFNPAKGSIGLSYKDLILIAGGIFLLVKSTMEISHKIKQDEHDEDPAKRKPAKTLPSVLLQIVLVDAVFSFDSILTAVGLVDSVLTMIIAVVVSIIVMMSFAGFVTRVINQHPSLQMLALSFLVVIGVVLIAGGFHEEVNKSIIYSCLGFSLTVELLNIKMRKQEDN
jgi:predicted tellurium resistance membrane protein TerC